MILIHLPVFVEKGTYKIENNAFSLTDFIKMKRRFDRTGALRRKPNSTFLTEHLLVSSRLHDIVLR